MAHKQTTHFRANLAAFCSERGDIQSLATKAGLSRVYLSRIINGHAEPSLEIASRIADAAEVPLSVMIASRKEFSEFCRIPA